MTTSNSDAWKYDTLSDDGELAAVGEFARWALHLGPTEEVPAGIRCVYPYHIHVGLSGTTQGASFLMVHHRAIPPAELEDMVKTCLQDVRNRMQLRRRATRFDHTPTAKEISEHNLMMFQADMKFFEAALCDRFDFRVQHCRTFQAEVEPMIKA